MQKRLLSLILCVLALDLLFTLTTSTAQGKSALEVAKEFYEAGMEADFEKLTALGCKNAGPATTYQDAIKLDLTAFGFIEQVIREEDSGIDLENLKLVVVRVKALGTIGFGAFYMFESPRGYNAYISPKGEFFYEYPPDRIDLMETAVDFYVSNKINLDKTIELVQTILKSKPNDLEANHRLGYLYHQKGWHEKGVSQYTRLVMLDKDYAEKKLDMRDLIAIWRHMLTVNNKEWRYYAAERLYATGDREVVPILVEKYKEILLQAKRRTDRIRINKSAEQAVITLVRISPNESIPILLEALENDEVYWSCYDGYSGYEYNILTRVLGNMGDSRSVPALLRRACEINGSAPFAAEALGEIGDKRVVPELKEALGRWILKDPGGGHVHERYLKALTKITGEDWLGFLNSYWSDQTYGIGHFLFGDILDFMRALPPGRHERHWATTRRYLDPGSENYTNVRNWIFERWKEFRDHEEFAFEYNLIRINPKTPPETELVVDVRISISINEEDTEYIQELIQNGFEVIRKVTYLGETGQVYEMRRVLDTVTLLLRRVDSNEWKIADIRGEKRPTIETEQIQEVRFITIRPHAFSEAKWDEYGPGYDHGSFEKSDEIWARKVGYVSYTFNVSEVDPQAEGFEVDAVLSSELRNTTAPRSSIKYSSDVTLMVNKMEVGTINIIPDDEHGKIYSWTVPATLIKKRENTLTFQVKEGAQHRNGLVVYTRRPIRIRALVAELKPKEEPKMGSETPVKKEEASGLKADYFNLLPFYGKPSKFPEKPVLCRLDKTIDFNWGDGSPDPAIFSDYFGVRWTGFIYIPAIGVYKFDVRRDDGCRLWVGDKLIFDSWYEGDWDHWIDFDHYFEKIGWHPLKLEFYEIGGGARITLKWQLPGESSSTVIPLSHLRTSVDEGKPT